MLDSCVFFSFSPTMTSFIEQGNFISFEQPVDQAVDDQQVIWTRYKIIVVTELI